MFKTPRAVAAVTAILASCLAPRLAAACGASAPTEWRLEGVLPQAEQPVPTDGAIVIRRHALVPVGAGNPDATNVVVTVRDAANVEVPGVAALWYDEGSSLVWTPQVPFAPNAALSIEAKVGAPSSAPTTMDGTRVSATLHTAAGPAAALHLLGDLTVSIEAYDQPTTTLCPASCGGSCPPGPPVRALRARVTIPAVSGGFAPTDFLAWLWLTDDHPHVLPDGPSPGGLVNLGGIERLGTGAQPTVAFRELPEEAQDYAPCFSVRVFDPAGHYQDLTKCLPKMNVGATLAELDRNRPAGAAGSTGTSAAGSTGTGAAGSTGTGAAGSAGTNPKLGSGGCSVGGFAGSDAAWTLLLLALIAFRVRRRRAAR